VDNLVVDMALDQLYFVVGKPLLHGTNTVGYFFLEMFLNGLILKEKFYACC
jgi:hypothetical protein